MGLQRDDVRQYGADGRAVPGELEHRGVADAGAARRRHEWSGQRELGQRRRAPDEVDLAVGLRVDPVLAGLAEQVARIELEVVPAEVERPDAGRPPDAVPGPPHVRARLSVGAIGGDQGVTADELQDRPHAGLHQLPVHEDLRVDRLRWKHRRQVGLVESHADQAEVRMALHQLQHSREPGGLELGHHDVGVGDDERVAHRAGDAVREGWNVLVRRPQDHLVEAVPVGVEPVPDLGARGVVDDREAVGLGRARLEGVERRDQVLEPVVGEHDDVDRLSQCRDTRAGASFHLCVRHGSKLDRLRASGTMRPSIGA
jgi:hypothetical protein